MLCVVCLLDVAVASRSGVATVFMYLLFTLTRCDWLHLQVFDPATGVLNKLDIDFEETMSGLNHIYDLCDTTATK